MILTIAIPTIESRRREFELLYDHLKSQVIAIGAQRQVEVIFERDNKQISIGAKRQLLIDKAQGKYLVMVDDDDWVPFEYVHAVLEAAQKNPDCIGYLENCDIQGKRERSCFSLKYKDWADKVDGYDHVRSPFFKTPILTDLCKIVGCADLRFGEDHDFAKRIYPFLKTEEFINEELYFYRYKSEPHNAKYGIKR